MLEPLRRLQVERFERAAPLLHARKLPKPYKALRIAEIAVVPHWDHAAPFLAFDEMAFEERNELLTPVRLQHVPTKFDDVHDITIRAGHSLEKSHFPTSPQTTLETEPV